MRTARIYFEGTLIQQIECTGIDYICREDSILLYLIDVNGKKAIVGVVPNTYLIKIS